jgi:hypothetical protein
VFSVQVQDTRTNCLFSNQEQYKNFTGHWDAVRGEGAFGPRVIEGPQKPILFVTTTEFISNIQAVAQRDYVPPF